MPYVIRLATDEDRALVVTALRTGADQRTRVALGASRKVAEAKRAGTDVRSQAVKVTNLLAEADVLATLATELEAAEALPVLSQVTDLDAMRAALAGKASGVDVSAAIDEQQAANPSEADDGTSPAAKALAAAAGLKDAIILEDGVDTGAIAEDDPDGDDVEEVLA